MVPTCQTKRSRINLRRKSLKTLAVLSLLLIAQFNYGQDSSTVKSVHDYPTKLQLNPYSRLKYFIGTPIYYFRDPTLFYPLYGSYYAGNIAGSDTIKYDLSLIRENLNKSFLIMREGQRKYDLGVVGQILGYTNAAAAVGLAIYHISKYGIK